MLTVESSSSFSTTIKDTSTENTWKIITMTENKREWKASASAYVTKKRVTGVSISFTAGSNDAGANCTDANMAALHNDVVTAFQAHVGSGAAEPGTY